MDGCEKKRSAATKMRGVGVSSPTGSGFIDSVLSSHSSTVTECDSREARTKVASVAWPELDLIAQENSEDIAPVRALHSHGSCESYNTS